LTRTEISSENRNPKSEIGKSDFRLLQLSSVLSSIFFQPFSIISMKKILIFVGPPGSGKTTFAEAVIKKYGFVFVSAGQLLRQFAQGRSKLAKKVASALQSGRLAPNWVTNKLVERELSKRAQGFILDGYPRSPAQARTFVAFAKKLSPKIFLVKLEISDADVIKRLSSRVYCPIGGEPYKKPTKICPKHKEKLVRRPDDEPAAIKRRLLIYRKNLKPVEGLLKKIAVVFSVKTPEKKSLAQNIKAVLQAVKDHIKL